MPTNETELPVAPLARPATCPLEPPAEFVDWRAEPGLRRVMYHGQPAWALSRYHDIREGLLDPRLSANTMPGVMKPADPERPAPVIFARIDDPEHNRLRRMVTGDFTYRRCEAMRVPIQDLVDGYLDEMIANGPPADLVRDFAVPVPSMVIALLLGVPPEDLGLFQEHTSVGLDTNSTEEQRAHGMGAMFAYIEALVKRKERDPGDDMISRLVTNYVATGQLTRETATMTAVIMLIAGHETTANMLSLGTLALLQHRDVFELLGRTEDPAVIANAVEELMRYLSIVHSQVDRVATEDLTIDGQVIRAGEFVLMNLPAGNWDPEFVENPGMLDVHRNTRGHVGFGYGVHQCVGQNLARVEMQVGFATLARRLPGLELAVAPEDLTFKEADIYGMKALPVRW
jgi:cytochrome P450